MKDGPSARVLYAIPNRSSRSTIRLASFTSLRVRHCQVETQRIRADIGFRGRFDEQEGDVGWEALELGSRPRRRMSLSCSRARSDTVHLLAERQRGQGTLRSGTSLKVTLLDGNRAQFLGGACEYLFAAPKYLLTATKPGLAAHQRNADE
jgi:hypothetical protein